MGVAATRPAGRLGKPRPWWPGLGVVVAIERSNRNWEVLGEELPELVLKLLAE